MKPQSIELQALDIEQFSKMYGLNARTVATNVSRAPHLLPKVTRFGRSIRFLKSDIENWINKQHQA